MKQIVLLELDSFHHGRGVLEGIRSFARPSGLPWAFHLFRWHELKEVVGVRPDGIIANLPRMECRKLSTRTGGRPVVSVLNSDRVPLTTAVFPDDVALGKAAAEYFIHRGFREFAVVDTWRTRFARQRVAGFFLGLRGVGHRLRLWSTRGGPRGRRAPMATAAMEGREAAGGPGGEPHLREWVRRLPKPVAIFCPADLLGFQLLEQCRLIGTRIPDDVAVLGVDDDPVRCELATPTLSSIRQPSVRVGFEAAGLLQRLMAGEGEVPAGPILVPPLSPVTRQSSDVLAVEDADLAAALRMIREHAHDPINVADILKKIPVTRRWLERAFMRTLGRSPLQDITRVKIDRAKMLLEETELSVREVAGRSGFSDAQKLTRAFKAGTGDTPGAYRDRFRVRV